MAKQSEELTEFYYAYAEWIDKGAPKSNLFSCQDGLCAAIFYYYDGDFGLYQPVRSEMRQQFYRAKLDTNYPFNHEGCSLTAKRAFDSEMRDQACHLNPKRTKWVRDHLVQEQVRDV